MVQCLSNINPSKITSILDQDRGKEGLTGKGPTSNGVTLCRSVQRIHGHSILPLL